MAEPTFHLEINSFEEFVRFVAFIRGAEMDAAQLADMAARLKTATTELEAAEHDNAP